MSDIPALQAAYDEARANAEAALQASITIEERVEAARAALNPYMTELTPYLYTAVETATLGHENDDGDEILKRLIVILPEGKLKEIIIEAYSSQQEEKRLSIEAEVAGEKAKAAKAELDISMAAVKEGGARRIYRKSQKGRKSPKSRKTRKAKRANRKSRKTRANRANRANRR
jgi:hypothetical protein